MVTIILTYIILIPAEEKFQSIILFEKIFGGKKNDYAFAGQQTIDGGFVIVGDTYSFGAGKRDIWLIKTDKLGNVLWDRTFGGKGDEGSSAVQETSDGGFIIGGSVSGEWASPFKSPIDIWLIKTNNKGNKLWEKTCGRDVYDYVSSVQESREGGYIIVGGTQSIQTKGFDLWLIKTDELGNIIWDRILVGRAGLVEKTSDEGYIIVGSKDSLKYIGTDIWLIKTDRHGHIIWEKSFEGKGHGNNFAGSLQVTRDEGYIITNYTNSLGGSKWKSQFKKIDKFGNIVWERTYENKKGMRVLSAHEITEGGYIIVGDTYCILGQKSEVWLIKTDEKGNIQWKETYRQKEVTIAIILQVTKDGYIIIGGTTWDTHDYADTDIWLTKWELRKLETKSYVPKNEK